MSPRDFGADLDLVAADLPLTRIVLLDFASTRAQKYTVEPLPSGTCFAFHFFFLDLVGLHSATTAGTWKRPGRP